MSKKLNYKFFEEGQENRISEMIWDVFLEFEAPDYSKKGIKTFKEFINPDRLVNKIKNNELKIFCCFEERKIVGVLAFRVTTGS